MCACVHARACVCVCMLACMHVRARVCMQSSAPFERPSLGMWERWSFKRGAVQIGGYLILARVHL